MSSAGCAVGRAVIPCWRSMRTKAVAWSRVAGIGVSLVVVGSIEDVGPQSVQGRCHGWSEQGRQIRDVLDRVQIVDGVLDGGLAGRGDHRTSQAAVLVHDVDITELPVASSAGVRNDLFDGAAVLECEA